MRDKVDVKAALHGSEIEKDVGIANQHRARLRARIAGNVAAGLVRDACYKDFSAQDRNGGLNPRVQEYDRVALDACSIADAILERCGL